MKKILLVLGCLTTIGCTDTDWAELKTFGDEATIRLYAADGHTIQEWRSTGRVTCTQGGICQFMDAKTHQLVQTTGDIVVFYGEAQK